MTGQLEAVSPSHPAQPFGSFFERRVVLRETEAQHGQLGRRGIERRYGNGSHARLAQQRVGKLDVALLRDRAEVEQLEISAGRRRPAEAGVAQAVEEPVALALVVLAELRVVL